MHTMAASIGNGGDNVVADSPATQAPSCDQSVRRVAILRDSMSFAERQRSLLAELDRRTHNELRRRQRDWQYVVQRMRTGFLQLLPVDNPDRKSSVPSADILPVHKVRTPYFEYDEAEDDDADDYDTSGGRRDVTAATTSSGGADDVTKKSSSLSRGRFQIRFDVTDLDAATIFVDIESDVIVVRGSRPPGSRSGTESTAVDRPIGRQYMRRVAKPDMVDRCRLRAFLSADGVLTVEAPLSSGGTVDGPLAVGERDMTVDGKSNALNGVVSTSKDAVVKLSDKDDKTKKPNGEAGKSAGRSDAVSSSPRGSPYDAQGGKATSAPGTDSPSGGSGGAGDGSTPAKEKIGVPIFRDECGTRRMHLAVDLGSMYRPHDVIVQVIKENRIQIRAKHREKSGERQSKNKFTKDYELGEKIEPFSLQGGLTASGKLIVCAYAKGHAPAVPE